MMFFYKSGKFLVKLWTKILFIFSSTFIELEIKSLVP